MTAFEVNFDGLIGPSHNYGGLSDGNLASATHAGAVSNPCEAALQGLEKMRMMLRSGRAPSLHHGESIDNASPQYRTPGHDGDIDFAIRQRRPFCGAFGASDAS